MPLTDVSGKDAVLPLFRFHPAGRTRDEAFEMWRGTMSNMFLVEKLGSASSLPQGGMSVFVLGDLLANRSTFNVQRLTRDARRLI